MSLRKATPVIPILGLDTNADPKSAAPGTLDIAENVWFKRTVAGGAEARKRFGATVRAKTIVTGGNVAAGKKLASRGDEQLLITDTGMMSWSSQLSKWVAVPGALPRVGVTTETIANRTDSTGSMDVAFGGGLACYVYTTVSAAAFGTNHARVVVIDLATGVHVLDSALGFSTPASLIKVVALNSLFMILCSFGGGSNTISARSIAFATPTVISATTNVATDLSTTVPGHRWDIIRNGSNDSIMVAYRSTVPNIKLLIWTSGMASGGTATGADGADAAIGWLNWDFSDGNGYLSYVAIATGLKTLTVQQSAFSVSATTVNDAAVTTARNLTGFRLGSTNNIFVERDGAATDTAKRFIARSTGGAVTTYQRGVILLSKAFARGSNRYIAMGYDNVTAFTVQPSVDGRTSFILDVTNTAAFSAIEVGKAFSGQSAGQVQLSGLPFAATVDSNTVVLPMRAVSAARGQFVLSNTYSAELATLDFAATGFSGGAQVGGTLYLPGGVVRAYDGATVHEAGFAYVPDAPVLTQAVGGAGLTLLGTYQVKYCWAHLNSVGEVSRSAFSPSVQIILTGANDTITAACETLRLTEKPANSLFVELYCTVNTGATFTLVAFGANNVTVDAISVDVPFGDTFIAQCTEAYDTGGERNHEPFPPARLVEVWSDRLFLAGTDHPTELWVSDELVPGEGVGVSSANAITMEQTGGPITALAEMDDRLIIGKATGTNESIYELTGRGPAANGDGQYDQPARITAVVGPVGPDAVVKTPQGVLFKSSRGFHLLPIGGGLPMRLRGVEAFEGLTFTGAAMLRERELAVITSATGTTLVYHFGFKDQEGLGRWATWTGQSAVDCAVWGGKFVYLQTGGDLQEEGTGWADNGAAIARRERFSWLNLVGLFGRLRLYDVQILLDILASFTVSTTVAYDFDDAGTKVPLETDTLAVTAGTLVPLCLAPRYERGTSIHVTIQETSTTEGYRLTALGLEVGLKGGAGKYPGAQFMT